MTEWKWRWFFQRYHESSVPTLKPSKIRSCDIHDVGRSKSVEQQFTIQLRWIEITGCYHGSWFFTGNTFKRVMLRRFLNVTDVISWCTNHNGHTIIEEQNCKGYFPHVRRGKLWHGGFSINCCAYCWDNCPSIFFSKLHLNNSKHVSKLLLRMAFQSCEYYIVADSRRAVSPVLKSGFLHNKNHKAYIMYIINCTYPSTVVLRDMDCHQQYHHQVLSYLHQFSNLRQAHKNGIIPATKGERKTIHVVENRNTSQKQTINHHKSSKGEGKQNVF